MLVFPFTIFTQRTNDLIIASICIYIITFICHSNFISVSGPIPMFHALCAFFIHHCACPDIGTPPGVEDVVAGQFLGSGHHLLSADDAYVIRDLEVFRSGVWIAGEVT